MANSNSIQLALSVVSQINDAKRGLRGNVSSYKTMLAKLETVMVDPVKKAILLDGLDGIKVDPVELKAEKDALVAELDHVLANVPELTK